MTVSAHWRRAGCSVSCSAGAFEVENQFSVGSLRAGRDRDINIRGPQSTERAQTPYPAVVAISGTLQGDSYTPYRTLSTNTVHVDVPCLFLKAVKT